MFPSVFPSKFKILSQPFGRRKCNLLLHPPRRFGSRFCWSRAWLGYSTAVGEARMGNRKNSFDWISILAHVFSYLVAWWMISINNGRAKVKFSRTAFGLPGRFRTKQSSIIPQTPLDRQAKGLIWNRSFCCGYYKKLLFSLRLNKSWSSAKKKTDKEEADPVSLRTAYPLRTEK